MSKQEKKKETKKVAPGEPSFNDIIANDRKATKEKVKEGDYTKVTGLTDD